MLMTGLKTIKIHLGNENNFESLMKKQSVLESIQILRAVAATAVVLLHTRVYLYGRDLAPDLGSAFEVGRAGVDIFFVISGFIMVCVINNSFQVRGASMDFMLRRIIRIVPTYWAYTLLLAGFLIFAPQLFSGGKSIDYSHLAASLFFMPWTNSLGSLKPTLQVGWTLNYEMYFYLIVALLLLLPKRYFMGILTCWFVGTVALAAVIKPETTFLSFYTKPIVLEFVAGAFIANAYLNGVKFKYPLLCLAIGSLMILATIFFDTSTSGRWYKWGIAGAFLVLGCIALEQGPSLRLPRWLVKLGDSSYSLYLSHIFTINGLGFIWGRLIGDHYWAFCIVAILASIIVGHVAYLIFEKTATAYLNRQHKQRLKSTL